MRYLILILLVLPINCQAFDLWQTATLTGVQQRNNLAVYLPLTSDLSGNVTATYTRSAQQSVVDFEGATRTAPSGNTPLFTGANTLVNYWTLTNSMDTWPTTLNMTRTSGATDPLGGTTAWTLTASAANAYNLAANYNPAGSPPITLVSGDVLRTSIWVRRKTGTGTVRMGILQDGTVYTDIQALISSTWTKLQLDTTVTTTTGNRYPGFYVLTSGDAIDVWQPMIERINSQTYKPRPYLLSGATPGVSVSGTKPTNTFVKSVFIGDSITGTGGLSNHYVYHSRDVWMLDSTQVVAKGVAGNTLAQIDARFAADVTALAPNIVLIQGGINDVYEDASLSTMQTRLQSIVAKSVAAGIPFILSTISPHGTYSTWTQARQDVTEAYNTWIRTYAASNGYPILDMYEFFRDPGTINMAAIHGSADGLHPGIAGATLYGQYIASLYPNEFVDVGSTAKGILLDTTTALSIPSPAVIKSGSFYWTPKTLAGTQWLMGSYTSAAVQTGIFYDGTNVTFRKRLASTNYDATKTLTAVAGTTYLIRWEVKADNRTAIYVDGVQGTDHTNTTAPTWAATIKIGNDGNSANQQVGSIKEFKILK